MATSRRLRDAEIALARTVFGSSLPYDLIYLCDNTGAWSRPFTNSEPGGDHYFVHVGPIYADATSTAAFDTFSDGTVACRYCDVFIHELTHVWQGEHRGGFIWNSLWHQAWDKDAYAYTAGAAWSSYNVEQQAHIVEDWFNARLGNRGAADPRYRYITGNILVGNAG